MTSHTHLGSFKVLKWTTPAPPRTACLRSPGSLFGRGVCGGPLESSGKCRMEQASTSGSFWSRSKWSDPGCTLNGNQTGQSLKGTVMGVNRPHSNPVSVVFFASADSTWASSASSCYTVSGPANRRGNSRVYLYCKECGHQKSELTSTHRSVGKPSLLVPPHPVCLFLVHFSDLTTHSPCHSW